jgi:Spy/CpxP family protein refolding chaperone
MKPFAKSYISHHYGRSVLLLAATLFVSAPSTNTAFAQGNTSPAQFRYSTPTPSGITASNKVETHLGSFNFSDGRPDRMVIAAEVIMTGQELINKVFAGVNLTPSQKSQIQGIRQMRSRRLKVALTTPQFSNLDSSLKSGQTLNDAISNLKPPLSTDQKQRIGNILQDSINQIWNVLTPPQQQTVTKNLENLQKDMQALE